MLSIWGMPQHEQGVVGKADIPEGEECCPAPSGSAGPSAPESRLWLSCGTASPEVSDKSLHLQ